MSRLRIALATAIARLAAVGLRLVGSGATSLPGKILTRLAPEAIAAKAANLERGCAVVSATNGKTTTCAMVASILSADGATTVHNRAGANMAGGIAATLLTEEGDFGLFEVDEFWLDGLVPQLRPRATLLANLFRDQLDRYGELDQIIERWRRVAESPDAGSVVLNADDPLVAGLGAGAEKPFYFGIEDETIGEANPQHASEQAQCPVCHKQFSYSRYFVGHLGHYSCSNGHPGRPAPDVSASSVALDGLRGSRFTLRMGGEDFPVALQLPGLYNVYNAVAAAALGVALGIQPTIIASAIEQTSAAFGRAETVQIGGRDASIMLVKNPAGANEVLRTLADDPGDNDLLIILNSRIADGRDVSWIWDADFELLAASSGVIVCSGERAPQIALRLKYAGIAPERIAIEADLPTALELATSNSSERLVILPTYTAMLALRELLVGRGELTEALA